MASLETEQSNLLLSIQRKSSENTFYRNLVLFLLIIVLLTFEVYIFFLFSKILGFDLSTFILLVFILGLIEYFVFISIFKYFLNKRVRTFTIDFRVMLRDRFFGILIIGALIFGPILFPNSYYLTIIFGSLFPFITFFLIFDSVASIQRKSVTNFYTNQSSIPVMTFETYPLVGYVYKFEKIWELNAESKLELSIYENYERTFLPLKTRIRRSLSLPEFKRMLSEVDSHSGEVKNDVLEIFSLCILTKRTKETPFKRYLISDFLTLNELNKLILKLQENKKISFVEDIHLYK